MRLYWSTRLRQNAKLGLCWAACLALGACQAGHAEEPGRAPNRAAQPTAPAGDARPPALLDLLAKHPKGTAERAAFVQAQIDEARFSATAAMRAWAAADATLAENAYGFLRNSEDLAVRPAVEQPLPREPQAAAQALWLIGDAEIDLRGKVLLRVDALLDDKRALPSQAGQVGAPRRVCDEAYVTLRRMVRFEEPELRQPFTSPGFLASTPAARDALIQHVRRAPTWRRILVLAKEAAR
jgi:hypothetical protein